MLCVPSPRVSYYARAFEIEYKKLNEYVEWSRKSSDKVNQQLSWLNSDNEEN